jgi:NADPH:quinone reductase-like Zn-dependent oxidoreductase
MRAISISEYRGDARLGKHDMPSAGPGQMLVKVQAAGMNPLDQAIASGAFSERVQATFPLILGVDFAGVVYAVGAGLAPYSIGDRVFGQLLTPGGSGGAYADYVAVPADATVASVPAGVSSEVAASLPTPGVTALQLARLLESSGAKTVAVAGAGGAVGGFLTQLLVSSGVCVLAVSLPPQADRVRSYGAQEVIDATAAPTEHIRELVSSGVDTLVDLVSDPEHFALLAETVRSGGAAISTRYVADVGNLAQRNIEGVNFRVGMTATDLGLVAALIASGELMPPPIRTVRFEEVPDLLNVGGSSFDGKTVIRPE